MTQQFLIWVREDSTLRLYGNLNRDVLNSLWNKRFEVMHGIILIDLSAVIYVDTAGIALLVHLVETGKKQGSNIMLTGVNNNMLNLVKLYNLPNDILPY